MGAQRHRGLVAQALDQRQRAALGAQQAALWHEDVVQAHVGRPGAIHGRVFLQRHAGRVALDPEQADAVPVAPGAAGARAYHQMRGPRRGHHHRLVAAKAPATLRADGAGLYIVQAVTAARLGMRPGHGGFAADDRRQPAGGQCLAAMQQGAAA